MGGVEHVRRITMYNIYGDDCSRCAYYYWSLFPVSAIAQNRPPRICAQPYSRGWTWDRQPKRAEWWCSNWSAYFTCSSSCSTYCWCSCLLNRQLSSTSCCTPCWLPLSSCWEPYPASPRTSECRLQIYIITIRYINI